MVVGRRGRRDKRNGWTLPKGAGKRRREASIVVKFKALSTIKNYRKGLHFMWKKPRVRRQLQRYGVRPVGGWNTDNQLGGDLFAAPSEIDFLTDEMVDRLMLMTWEEHPTKAQFKKVRAFFSFAWQLKTGEVNLNFPCVEKKRKLLAPCGFSPKIENGGEATKWLSPEQMRAVLSREWTPNAEMPLPRYSVLMTISTDFLLNACRPVGLNQKIKKSRDHYINVEQRFMWTEMQGGRAKLEKRMEPRPWKAYRVCSCPGTTHKGLPSNYRDQLRVLDERGFPRNGNANWCTACPLTCFETIKHYTARNSTGDPRRIYPRWSTVTNKYGECIGRKKIHTELQSFFAYQGVNPHRIQYSKNGGRKSNGRLCDALNIPYKNTLDWHGDKPRWWRKYQPGLPEVPESFTRRTQSQNPLTAIRGLVGIWQKWGRGEGMKGVENVKKEEPEANDPPSPPPAPEPVVKPENVEVQYLKSELQELKGKMGVMEGLMRQQIELLKQRPNT